MTEPAPPPDPASPTNPVARARLLVEAEVPMARRGPGWDRHWRELEAYAEGEGIWSDPADLPPPHADDLD